MLRQIPGRIAGSNLTGGVYRGAVPQRFGNRKPPSSASTVPHATSAIGAYMHNGTLKSRSEVVHFYNIPDVAAKGWLPPALDRNVNCEILEGVPLGNLELAEETEDATVELLKTLRDGYVHKNK